MKWFWAAGQVSDPAAQHNFDQLGVELPNLLRSAAAYEAMTTGTAVTVANNSVLADVLRGDGAVLGAAAPVAVSGPGSATFSIQGNLLFQANADLWILVEATVLLVDATTSVVTECPGARVRAHSYGTVDDTGRPQSISLTPRGQVTVALPTNGSNSYYPKMQIRCFAGLGGGVYIRDPSYAQVSIARVA